MPILIPLVFESDNFNYIHSNSQYCSISKLDNYRLLGDLFNVNCFGMNCFTCTWVFQLALCHNQPFLSR